MTSTEFMQFTIGLLLGAGIVLASVLVGYYTNRK